MYIYRFIQWTVQNLKATDCYTVFAALLKASDTITLFCDVFMKHARVFPHSDSKFRNVLLRPHLGPLFVTFCIINSICANHSYGTGSNLKARASLFGLFAALVLCQLLFTLFLFTARFPPAMNIRMWWLSELFNAFECQRTISNAWVGPHEGRFLTL